MVGALGTKPHAGAVSEPEPALLRLFPGQDGVRNHLAATFSLKFSYSIAGIRAFYLFEKLDMILVELVAEDALPQRPHDLPFAGLGPPAVRRASPVRSTASLPLI